jgi:four helix bundle protein
MSPETASFRSLDAWQRAQELAAAIAALTDRLPRTRAADTLGNQLLRSAASVAANIAEGYGRYSPGAYRNHLSIARGSLFETESWIDLLERSGYITGDETALLLPQCRRINQMLIGLMRSLPAGPARAVRDETEFYAADQI